MSTQQTLTDLTAPTRTREAAPERPSYTAPAVTLEEVANSMGLITDRYEPLGAAFDTIYDFAVLSCQSAHAAVQYGWTFAEVEKQMGDKRWFFNSWIPGMKEARESGTPLPEDTRQGTILRLRRREREVLKAAILPIFGEINDELSSKIEGVIIGRAQSHVRFSIQLLATIHGVSFDQMLTSIKENAKAQAANADAQDEEQEEIEQEQDAEATGTEG